jgi:iron complex outermembrane recepter protein
MKIGENEMRKLTIIASLLASASGIGFLQPALAQEAQPQAPQAASEIDSLGEIVVTARRRDETLISVPVVINAVSGETLQSRGVINLDGLSRIVPQLMIGNQGGSVQGGNISLRGIAGPDSNPFGDQAVSFTIDGIQVAKATVRRMSDFDVSQIEVLKGPQALFYGKNSMGGIVNIRTNDPGDTFEVGGKIGYEIEAREVRGEGYISIPISEGFGLRLAGQFSDMKGFLKDETPVNSVYFNTSRNPNSTDYGLRGTLKYDNGGTFDARLKVSFSNVKGNGPAATTAFTFCPSGSRQFSALGPVGDNSQCGPGDSNVNAGYGPVVSTIPFTRNQNYRADGKNFNDQDQYLVSLVMNFRPTEAITLTSATGFYKVKYDACQNYENSFAVILPSCNVYRNRELSQELNFSTDFNGRLNFAGGLYYSDVDAGTGSTTFLFGGQFPLLAPPGTPGLPNGLGGPDTPALVNHYWLEMKGKAYSAFIESTFDITDQLELSGGVRYTKEKKRLPLVLDGGGVASSVGNPFLLNLIGVGTSDLIPIVAGTPNAVGASLLKDKDSWKDWSPEITLSYRPTSDLTVFASYKHGFLSGSFNSSSVDFAKANLDLSYKPQTIKGFEIGAKAQIGGGVLLNAAAYTYKIDDLQVVNFTNATSSIRNAAKAQIDGFEADVTWRAPVDGLTLNGAIAYNKAKYDDFGGAPCYNGQSVAEGCVGGVQQLAGQVLPRSPKWNMQAGFNYDAPIGTSYKLGLSGGLNHSSSYLTDASNAPGTRQKAYTMFDGAVRFGNENDRWQISLIGRNLTNKFIFFATPDVPFTGNNAFGVRLGDRFGSLSRGREILLQVGVKFGK